jgi:hypothetical protein
MLKVKYTFFLLFLSFFLGGCEESFPVYTTPLQNNRLSVPCLHYTVLEMQDKKRVEKAFGIKDDPQCAYRVELTKYKIGACNNPVVKSVGGDFNGYVRIEVKKGFTSYFKAQSDYKNDMDAAFQRVLREIDSVTGP